MQSKHNTQPVILKLKQNVQEQVSKEKLDPQMTYHRSLREFSTYSKGDIERNPKLHFDASDWRNVKVYGETRTENAEIMETTRLDSSSRHMVERKDQFALMKIFRLSSCDKARWYTEIGIGAPSPQFFTVALDTGSSLMWVPSSICEEDCEDLAESNKYNRNNSTTYEEVPFLEDEDFAIRNMKGKYATDMIHFGRINGEGRASTFEQTFVEVTSLAPGSQYTYLCEDIDGVLGLNVDAGFNPDVRPPIFGVLEDYPISMFSLYFGTEDTSNDSQLILGGVDQNHYHGCLQWHKSGLKTASAQRDESGQQVIESRASGLWDFAIDDVLVGDETVMDEPVLAQLDSMSANIIGPASIVGEFATRNSMNCFILDTEGGVHETECIDGDFDVMEVECNPDIPSQFQDLRFIANGAEYSFNIFEISEVIENDSGEGLICRPTLVPSGVIPNWIMGTPFLTKYYSVYDIENMVVGLAKASTIEDSICEDDLAFTLNDENNLGDEDPPILQDGEDDDHIEDELENNEFEDDMKEFEQSAGDDYYEYNEEESQDKGPEDFGIDATLLPEDDALLLDSQTNPLEGTQSSSDEHLNMMASSTFLLCGIVAFALLIIRNKMKRSKERNEFVHRELGVMAGNTDDVQLFKIDDDLELT